MSPETLNVVLVVIVVFLAGYALYVRHKKGELTDASTLVATIENQIPFATELTEVAQIVVNEIEQSAREGHFISNDEKFNRALDLVKKWRPEFAKIDNAKVIAAIKSAVLVASALTHQIDAAKTQTLDANQRGVNVN